MPLELFRSLLSWLFILPAIFLTGRCYQPLISHQDPQIRGVIYCGLGLATLSYEVILLSICGLLRVPYIFAIVAFPILLGVNGIKDCLFWLRDLFRGFLPGKDILSQILCALFVISAVALLLGTLTPELGGDALCYQLNLPKVFLKQGAVTPDFSDYNSFFPLLVNNLYLIGLATGGVFSAKIFHFFYGFLLLSFIKRLLEIETKKPSLAYFIALVVWTTPTIYNTLSTSYIDVALAFYTFSAVILFFTSLREGKCSWLFVAGLFAGSAFAIKYIALISGIALFFVWFCSMAVTKRWYAHLTGITLFLIGVALFSIYYLARNAVMTGNPFFPYWGMLFGEANRPHADLYVYGVGQSWFHLLSVYFNMFINPEAFGTSATRIGIFYFLLTPFVILSLLFVRFARLYALFGIAFTAISFFVGQADRWIMPVLPVMALSAGYGIHWLHGYGTSFFKKLLKYGAGSLVILILCFYVMAGVYHYRYAVALYTNKWSIGEYLLALERTTGIAEWVNQNLPQNAKILIESETRVFYFDRPVMRYTFLDWRMKLSTSAPLPENLASILRNMGVTHILIRVPLGDRRDAFTGIAPVLKALLFTSFVREIYNTDSHNIREARYHYRVFKIVPN